MRCAALMLLLMLAVMPGHLDSLGHASSGTTHPDDSNGNRFSEPTDIRTDAGKRPVALFPPAANSVYTDHLGKEVDLRDLSGRILIVNFWATWCPPCRYEIPHLVALRSSYADEDLAIIGISLDHGSKEQLRPLLTHFVEQYDINYPIIVDPEFGLLRHFVRGDLTGVAIPMTFVLDRQGNLFSTHEGLPQRGGRPDPGGVLTREIQTLLGRD